MSLKKKGVEGVKWTIIESLFIQFFALITTILLTRLLIPEDFGVVGIIMVFLVISRAIIESGLGSSIIQDQNANKEDYTTVFYANLVISLIIYVLLYFIAPAISAFYEDGRLTYILRILGISVIISAISGIQAKVLTKELKFKKLTILRTPGIIIGSIIAILSAYNGLGYWSLVIKELVTRTLDAIMFWSKSKWSPTLNFNLKKLKKHYNYGYKLMLTSLLSAIFTEIYALMIGKYFSISTLGYYNRANKFITLPRKILVNVVTKPIFPLLSKYQDAPEKITEIYKKLLGAMFFIVAYTFVSLGAIAQPLFNSLLSPKWQQSVEYFQILCFGAIIYPALGLNLNIFKVYARTDITLKLALYRKILVLIVLFIGINFGMEALLWGIVASSYAAFFINAWYSKKFLSYGIWEQIKDLTPTLIIALGCGALGIKTVTIFNPDGNILSMFISLVVMTFTYISLNILLNNKVLRHFIEYARPVITSLLRKTR